MILLKQDITVLFTWDVKDSLKQYFTHKYNDPVIDAEGRKYPFSYPFHTLDNVVLSPHRGASPKMDLRRWDDVLENICRFTTGKTNFLNIINIDEGY